MEITKDLLLNSNKKIIYNYTNETKYKTGVYKVTIGNHFYIGSASSKRGFYTRWHQHISDFKKNSHKNPKFQNCYNKYDSIQFDIIEFCSPEKCINREQYFIDLLKPDLNIKLIANSPLGVKQTLETINKRVEKLKGRKYSDTHKKAISEALKQSWKDSKSKHRSLETRLKRKLSHLNQVVSENTKEKISKRMLGNQYPNKVVYQYSKDKTIFIKEWPSAKIAAIELHLDGCHIASCCTGKRKSAYGYYWSHNKLF